MITPGFIEAGLAAIRDTLVAAADRAGLTLNHYPITRTAARRFRSRLRLLERLLRRLLVLMAARLDIEPARSAPAPVSTPHPARPAPAQAGAGPRPRGFALLPPLRYDAEAIAALRARPRAAPKPPAIAPLLHRYRTLLARLEAPDRLARRMARHLARLKRAGEACPVCWPLDGLHRLDAGLGLIAAALPHAIAEALSGWYDSG